MGQKVTQATVSVGTAPLPKSQTVEQIQLYMADGTPITIPATTAALLMTGYTSQSAGNVAATDTLNHAVAKLEARIAALEAA